MRKLPVSTGMINTETALLDANDMLRSIEKQYKLAKSVQTLALKLERQYGNLNDIANGRGQFCTMMDCLEVTSHDYCPKHDY